MPRPRKQPITSQTTDLGGTPVRRGAHVADTAPRKEVLLLSGRPQWEYRTIRSEDARRWTVDDVSVLGGAYGVFPDAFSSLGLQGWELVTIYKTGDAMHAPIYYAVFKRQKE